jgi:NAD-dependent SIR2 family protein deacetylase
MRIAERKSDMGPGKITREASLRSPVATLRQVFGMHGPLQTPRCSRCDQSASSLLAKPAPPGSDP